MFSSWKKRRSTKTPKELIVPDNFLCPISLHLMKDPVTLVSTGATYDRESIETWLQSGRATCPVTNQVLPSLDSVPNHSIRKLIQNWCVDNKSRGIERIPTPKVPISPLQVSEILSRIESSKHGNDFTVFKHLLSKIVSMAKESDRNKKCIVENGAGGVLSSSFDHFSNSDDLSREILSALMLISPKFDDDTVRNLSSSSSLEALIRVLKFGDLSARRNAVLAIKSIVSFDQTRIVKIEGALQAMVDLIKNPINSTTTKASLLAIYRIVSNDHEDQELAILELIEMGVVGILVEMLVDSERSICEKGLGVLDVMCSHGLGRMKAYENGLTVAVVVKKLLRVSELATELGVSVLLKMGKNDEKTIVEALEVGAFQKLLLALQIGGNEEGKEELTKLLKLLNLHRNRVECIDSGDFKDLKRSG